VTLRKNVASQKVPFVLVNASTGAALTGATVTATISKDGGAQATATGTVAELGLGQYLWSPAQADTNANSLGVIFTASSAIPVGLTIFPTSADPTDSVRLGLTALPSVAAGASGGLPTGDASGRVTVGALASGTITTASIADGAITAAKFAANALDAVWSTATRLLTAGTNIVLSKGVGVTGFNDPAAATVASAVRTELTIELGRIDVATSTRLASSSYTTPLDAAGVRTALGLASANLDTQLDALPTAAETASATRTELTVELGRIDASVSSRLATSGYTAPLTAATTRAALGLASANLDTQLDALPTAAEVASAVRTDLTTELGRIDASVSSRLSTAGYTAPLNAAGTRTALGLASANLDTQLNAMPTASETAVAVWEEPLASHTTAGTYGGRIVRASSASVELALTGSHHAAADIHELQPGVLTAAAFAGNAIAAAAVAADVGAEIASAVRSELATELGRVDVAVSTRLSTAGYTAPDNASITAIKAKTDNLPVDPADQSAVDASIAGLLTTPIVESYNADGSAPTVAQALMVMMQRLTEFSISGTTITVKKLDGSTTAFALTLDDASVPTSSTRST